MKDISKILTDEQKNEVLEKAKELLASNEENFSDVDEDEKMDENPYAAGVHDGILDILLSLGINIDEEDWYN